MSSPAPTVYVVDDDPAARDSLRKLLKSVNLPAETYASADEFLERYDPARPGCLILDVRMPGMSGLDLQDQLRAADVSIPIVFTSGHGDIPIAVRVMRGGAVDFIEKPFRAQALLDRIYEAIAQDAQLRQEQSQSSDFTMRLALLTAREREVMDQLVVGQTVKEVAGGLGISHKTVQVHRVRILEKMQVSSMTKLARLATAFGAVEGLAQPRSDRFLTGLLDRLETGPPATVRRRKSSA